MRNKVVREETGINSSSSRETCFGSDSKRVSRNNRISVRGKRRSISSCKIHISLINVSKKLANSVKIINARR